MDFIPLSLWKVFSSFIYYFPVDFSRNFYIRQSCQLSKPEKRLIINPYYPGGEVEIQSDTRIVCRVSTRTKAWLKCSIGCIKMYLFYLMWKNHGNWLSSPGYVYFGPLHWGSILNSSLKLAPETTVLRREIGRDICTSSNHTNNCLD